MNTTYTPTRTDFLVGPYRRLESEIFGNISRRGSDAGIEVSSMPQLYKHFTYEDLASHPGVIFIPYQVECISNSLNIYSNLCVGEYNVHFRVVSDADTSVHPIARFSL